jgi:hypothetical protein
MRSFRTRVVAAADADRDDELNETQAANSTVAGRISHEERYMKSRLFIAALLVTGLVSSISGSGIATAQSSRTRDDASVAQYKPAPPCKGAQDTRSGDASVAQYKPHPRCAVLPAAERQTVRSAGVASAASAHGTNAARQSRVAELPFTGFAAIPLLLGGLALVGIGHLIRRR